MTSLHRLAIFTGSSSGHDPVYQNSVAELGSALARAGIGVVYGGGRIGLMGQIADSVLGAGGHVHGVIPDLLVEREQAHQGLSTLETVPDMHTRKARFGQLGDGFVALPGGMGTLEELS